MSKHFIDSWQFANCKAYALMIEGTYVGKFLVAYPKDGAGTLRAALLVFPGLTENPLSNCDFSKVGKARGFGYDKETAALLDVLRQFGHDVKDDGRGVESVFRGFGITAIRII